jgi:hypothetical protein
VVVDTDPELEDIIETENEAMEAGEDATAEYIDEDLPPED